MTEHTEATVLTDAELRALWQQAGGTIYFANREIGTMPIRALLPFIRSLMQPGSLESALAATLSPAKPDSGYAKALIDLIGAACPGLDTGNLFEDARKATEAFETAELAGHFGIDDEPATDGSARILMVGRQHAGDPDVFPLYRRAALKAEIGASAPAGVKRTGKGGTKAAGAQGGAS